MLFRRFTSYCRWQENAAPLNEQYAAAQILLTSDLGGELSAKMTEFISSSHFDRVIQFELPTVHWSRRLRAQEGVEVEVPPAYVSRATESAFLQRASISEKMTVFFDFEKDWVFAPALCGFLSSGRGKVPEWMVECVRENRESLEDVIVSCAPFASRG